VLSCQFDGAGLGPIRATSTAPDVNGRSAFWGKLSGSSTLFWQYAPGAWSILKVNADHWSLTTARAQMLMRVAVNVRYGNTKRLTFPFWTTDVPAGWTVSLATFLVSPSGEMLSQSVNLGPAASPATLEISVVHAISPNPCPSKAGPSQQLTNVTLDGANAVLTTDSSAQSVCAGDVDGLWVGVSVFATHPNGALGFARSLHLLGTRRSKWTTDPVR
jgi:hypothetical protein